MYRNRKAMWTINKTGNLVFPGDEKNLRDRYQAKSLFESEVVVYIIMIVCCILDIVMFKQLFNHLILDSPYVRNGAVIGMLMPFDFAPIYFGMKLKEKHQGYKVDKIMLIGLMATFLVGTVLYFALRVALQDVASPRSTQEAIIFSGGDGAPEQTSNPYALVFAIFTGIMPLLTSMVSLWVSYAVSNPLKSELHAYEKQKLELDTAISQSKSVITEYEADLNVYERLLEEDEQKYQAVCSQISRLACFYTDYVRVRIAQHLGEPAATNELSKKYDDKFLEQYVEGYHGLITEG